MDVTTTTEWLAEESRRLIDQYRDEAAMLARQFEHADGDNSRCIAALSVQARDFAWKFNRLGDELADMAGGLERRPFVHAEELLAEASNGEHDEDD
jgi:hypothetical protein